MRQGRRKQMRCHACVAAAVLACLAVGGPPARGQQEADAAARVDAWTTGGGTTAARAGDASGGVGVAQATPWPAYVIQGGTMPANWQPQAIPINGIGPDGRPTVHYYAPTYTFTYQIGPPVVWPQPSRVVNRPQTAPWQQPVNPYATWPGPPPAFAPNGYPSAYQQPAYQQPAYQQPAYQQPAYQQPAYQQPAFAQQQTPWMPVPAPGPAVVPAPQQPPMPAAAPFAQPVPTAVAAPTQAWAPAGDQARDQAGGWAPAPAGPQPPAVAAIAAPVPVPVPVQPSLPAAAAAVPPPVAALPVSTGGPAAAPVAAQATNSHLWRVVKVYDGDTVTCLDDMNQQQKVRLAGIDAPEKSQDFGEVSRQALAGMVFGKTIQVVDDGRDRYGRWIGRLYTDGIDVNRQMVASGNAWHYAAYSKDPSLAAAQSQAQAQGLGIWSQPNPTPPWEYRKDEKSR